MSGSGGGPVGINITANASQLTAQMAAAAQAAQAAGAAMQGASAGVSSMVQQMNAASAAMLGMVNSINQNTAATTRHTGATRASTQALTSMFGVAGLGRGQMMELGHVMRSLTDSLAAGLSPTRALATEIPRIAQVVLELGPAAMAGAAAVAALSIAAIAGVSALIQYGTQINAIRDAQYAMGTATQSALDQTLQMSNATASKFWESRSAVRSVAEEVSRIPGLSVAAQGPIIELATGIARINNKDAAETAKELVSVFSGGVGGMEKFLASNNLLTPQIKAQLDFFSETNDKLGAINLVVAQFTELMKGAAVQSKQMRDNFLEALQVGGNEVADLNSKGYQDPRQARLAQAPVVMPDPDEQRRNANAEAYNTTKREQLVVDKQIADIQTNLQIAQADLQKATAANNAADMAAARQRIADSEREIANARVRRDALVDPSVRVALEQQLEAIHNAAQAALVGADNSGRFNTALKGVTIPAQQIDMFMAAAAKYNVPPAILAWVAQHESGFNPSALGPEVNVGHGPERATGEAQILPSTAKQYGVDPTNQAQSIDFMAKYLRELFEKTGSYSQAVGKYGTYSPTQGAHSAPLQQDFEKTEQNNNISDTGGQNNPFQIRLQAAQQSFDAVRQIYTSDNALYRQTEAALVEATREAEQNKTQLKVAGLRGDQALTRDDYSQKVAIQDQILEELRRGGQEGTQAYKEAYEERKRLAQQSADEIFDRESESIKREIQLERGSTVERLAAVQQYVDRVGSYYTQVSNKFREALQFQEQVQRQVNQEIQQGNAQKIQEQIADLEKEKSAQQQTLAYDVQMGILSNNQKFNAEVQLVNNILAAETQLLNAKEALYKKDSAQFMEIEQQKANAASAAAREVTQLQQKENERVEGEYKEVAEGIASSMGSAITGIMNHSETMHQALIKVAQSIMDHFIQAGLKMAADWAARQIFMTLKTMASQTAQTTAVAAGQTAQTALTTAAKTEQAAVAASSNTSIIGGDAAKAAAGTYQSVAQIPYVGWILAPIAAAAAFAAVMAFGSGISSAEGGWDRVPADGMMTELHKNEMVLPAHIAEPMRGAISQWNAPKQASLNSMGAVNNNQMTSTYNLHYAPALSGSGGGMSNKDAKSFFSTHSSAMVGAIKDAHRTASLRVPRRS